jgi:hypothetical protein
MKEEAGFIRLDDAASQSIESCAIAYEKETDEMLRRWERKRKSDRL